MVTLKSYEPIAKWIEKRSGQPLSLSKHYLDLIDLIEKIVLENSAQQARQADAQDSPLSGVGSGTLEQN